jgi:flagellar protein FliS
MVCAQALSKYQSIKSDAAVLGASPHRLVQLLMEGAVERVVSAKGQIERCETAAKGANIGRALEIINHLRHTLDLDRGGEVALNLFALYEYMETRLCDANRDNDPLALEEVLTLMNDIRLGWDAIANEI